MVVGRANLQRKETQGSGNFYQLQSNTAPFLQSLSTEFSDNSCISSATGCLILCHLFQMAVDCNYCLLYHEIKGVVSINIHTSILYIHSATLPMNILLCDYRGHCSSALHLQMLQALASTYILVTANFITCPSRGLWALGSSFCEWCEGIAA